MHGQRRSIFSGSSKYPTTAKKVQVEPKRLKIDLDETIYASKAYKDGRMMNPYLKPKSYLNEISKGIGEVLVSKTFRSRVQYLRTTFMQEVNKVSGT